MFIRKVIHTDTKNHREYHTFKLLESLRTERGPRQRMVLNLGTDFSLAEDHWKDLANRIEEIVTRQQPLFTYGVEVERLAELYARKIIAYHGEATVRRSAPDYQRVDIDSLDHEQPRSVGAEHVVYETMKTLRLDELLTDPRVHYACQERRHGRHCGTADRSFFGEGHP